ncbi:unnamed protein product [Schistocephalus solidus]|uniref:Sulfotransfer_1 domain-containing protein n=1 Tax=Schistocephalus solidus TaxID=70667 RepID=A0A183TQI4_SCHSO|nr:unnamed protein product [Schistocephalus solidus]
MVVEKQEMRGIRLLTDYTQCPLGIEEQAQRNHAWSGYFSDEKMGMTCFDYEHRYRKYIAHIPWYNHFGTKHFDYRIFLDRDSVANALAGMHDAHTLVFDSKADSITAGIRTWSANLFASLHEDYETKRSQERITEINCFIDFLHNELDSMEVPPLA